MIFRTRRTVSMAAAALLASGAVTALSAPAYATGTETDLAIATAGTRVTDGVLGKVAWAKVINQGKGTPGSVLLSVDVSKVDTGKLIVESIFNPDYCAEVDTTTPGVYSCELAQVPGPGETTEVPIVLYKPSEDATGPYTAPVKISIESTDDTDDSNNSIEVDVELTAESGVDLGVIVPDVKTRFNFDTFEDEGPLRPGDSAILYSEVINQGDQIAEGLKLTYKLPKGVTFLPLEGCDLSGDKRNMVCTDKDFTLEPDTILFLPLPIDVSEDVKAPVTLTNGSLEATAFGVLKPTARLSAQQLKPAFAAAEVRKAEDSEFTDLDPSDNSDNFAVVVTAPSSGGGGGLPVTGVQAGLIGAVGAGVVLAGAAMFLVSRRRRVVMVTPGDEKSNS